MLLLTSLVEKSRAGFYKSVSDAFCISFFDAQFHTDTAIDSIIFHFWEVLR